MAGLPKLKIALLSAFLPPDLGGVPSVLGTLISEFLAAGLEIVVISPTPKPMDYGYDKVVWLQHEEVKTSRCAVERLVDGNQGTWEQVEGVMLKSGKNIAEALLPFHPDMINSHTEHFLCDIVAVLLNIPHVVTLHGYPPDPDDFLAAGRPDNPQMEIPRNIIRNLSSRTTMTTVSQFIRHRWVRCGVDSEKISVIGNPVQYQQFQVDSTQRDIIRRDIGIKESDLLVLCPQRTKRFGMGIVLSAIKLLNDQWPNIKLLICDTHLPPDLEIKAFELGIRDSIITRTFPYKEIAGAYKASDIVVLPDTHESFGLPCIEAIAAHRPVIACSSGSYNELLRDGETALLFRRQDPYHLAECACRLIIDFDLRKKLSEIPESEIENYHPFHIANQYIQYYQLAIDQYNRMPPSTIIFPEGE